LNSEPPIPAPLLAGLSNVKLASQPASRRVVLASASPRRRDLLDQLGVEFEVIPADIDESALPGEAPVDYVRRVAGEKADVVARRLAKAVAFEGDRVLVIAADTTVDLGGEILGKPADVDDARRMLRALSARTHRVHTAVAVCVITHETPAAAPVNMSATALVNTSATTLPGEPVTPVPTAPRTRSVDYATTLVTMTPITDVMLTWYLSTDEPMDKAGAYAVQGAGGVFVQRVIGSVSNVVGLPLALLARMCADLDAPLLGE
jgi:septum formation protein